MKYFLLIVCIIFAANASAQDFLSGMAPAKSKTKTETKSTSKVSLPDKPNKTDAQGRKQGEWATKYPNGRYRYTATFRDDKPVGKVTRFDEDGHKTVVMTYGSDDTCRVVTYHDNGKVESRGQYLGNKKVGVWRFFNYDGYPLSVCPYSDGKKHGTERLLYESGKLLEAITWVEGVRSGPWARYFAGGAKEAKGAYKLGVLDGPYTVWGSDGKVTSSGVYETGTRVGKWHIRYIDTPGLCVDILYDKHGVVMNRAEVDSVESLRVQYAVEKKGLIKDPADYVGNPEEYVPF